MKTLKELSKALLEGKQLKWNDPRPIKGNDYTITCIEDLTAVKEEDALDYPILIQYGEGWEAEVFLNEIVLK